MCFSEIKDKLIELFEGVVVTKGGFLPGLNLRSDWKDIHVVSQVNQLLANRSPALPGKYLMSLRHPSGHFTYYTKVLEFGVPWGPGVGLAGSCLC